MVVKKMFLVNDLEPSLLVERVGELLGKGVNVIIFPQGTRGGVKLARGAARLALASGAKIAAVHLKYDPPVLTKGQPWYEVGDKTILIDVEDRGEIVPEGENNHHNATAFTETIRDRLTGGGRF